MDLANILMQQRLEYYCCIKTLAGAELIKKY